jgi:hypothetical protein
MISYSTDNLRHMPCGSQQKNAQKIRQRVIKAESTEEKHSEGERKIWKRRRLARIVAMFTRGVLFLFDNPDSIRFQ